MNTCVVVVVVVFFFSFFSFLVAEKWPIHCTHCQPAIFVSFIFGVALTVDKVGLTKNQES